MLKPDEIEREVRYAHACCEQIFHFSPKGSVEELARDFIELSENTKPVIPGEEGIISLLCPKTAALLGDRVWLTFAGAEKQLDFSCGWSTPMEVRLAALLVFGRSDDGLFPEAITDDDVELTGPGEQFLTFTEGELAQDYAKVTGAHMIPLYQSTQERQRDYQPGQQAVLISVVQNIDIVSERSLTWEQVSEFRSDGEARTAYRRFAHWMDKEMVGKSATYIIDEVSHRLERYEWAVKKHGLKTVLGALERTLDAKSLIGSAAVTASIEAVLHTPLLSLLSGAGLLVGNAAVKAAAHMIEKKDIAMEYRDVSFVHEIKKRMN